MVELLKRRVVFVVRGGIVAMFEVVKRDAPTLLPLIQRRTGKRLHKCEMTKSEVTSGKSDLENPLPREISARERTGKARWGSGFINEN